MAKYEEMCRILRDQQFEDDVVEVFRSNRIDTTIFLELDKNDFAELGVTALGDKKKLLLLKDNLRAKASCSKKRVLDDSDDESVTVQNISKRLRQPVDLVVATGPSIWDDDNFEFDDSLGSGEDERSESVSPTQTCEVTDDGGDDCRQEKENDSEKKVEVLQCVPDRLPGWEDDFIVPKQYSQAVMSELTSGQITGTTRRAIVQDVTAKCLNYCKYPTATQIEVVASKIVAAYPVLADTLGTGHGSWAESMKHRFKNMRREPRSNVTGMKFKRPSRKSTVSHHLWAKTDVGVVDETTYNRHKQAMKTEMKKKGKVNKQRVMTLMKECKVNRQQWIMNDEPAVSEVQEHFPALLEHTMILEEFREVVKGEEQMTDKFAVMWEEWAPKILSYAKITKKSATREYLDLLSKSSVSSGQTDAVTMLILFKLLVTRPKDASDYFFEFVKPNEDIDDIISGRNTPAPYIIGTGEDILHVTELFIVVENVAQPFKITTFSAAVTTLMAYYYVFNIEYPAQTHLVCKFVEKFCFGLSNTIKLTASAIGVISSIEKQCV